MTESSRTPRVRRTPRGDGATPPSARRQNPQTSRTSYVGFKAVERRPQTSLIHGRNAVSAKSMPERAAHILETLDNMASNWNARGYENGQPQERLSTLVKMHDAHKFAWNEGSLQIKEYNNELATVFVRLKTFYDVLFDAYPRLFRDFDKKMEDMNNIVAQKDQHISELFANVSDLEERNAVSADMIHGLKTKLKHTSGRKKFYKERLNFAIMEKEQLVDEVTELKCAMAKQAEEFRTYLNKQEAMLLSDAEPQKTVEIVEMEVVSPVEHCDIGVNTQRARQSARIEVTTRSLCADRQESLEDLSTLIPLPNKQASLLRVIYQLMQLPVEPQEMKVMVDDGAEWRKFYWVYPKILSIIMSGMRLEDRKKPYTCFEDVVAMSLKEAYRTQYLVDKMKIELMRSVRMHEKADPAIDMFMSFCKGDYDFSQFRFLTALTEFSIGSVTPLVSDVMNNDILTPEETKMVISCEKAKELYGVIFPFGEYRPEEREDGTTGYWDFVTKCLYEFDRCRRHMWAVVKASFCLVDYPDMKHVTLKTFITAHRIMFPTKLIPEVKEAWTELTLRNKANERRGDALDFEAITFYVVGRNDLMHEIMNTSVIDGFMKTHREFNASILECLAFIVKRLVFYVPELQRMAPEAADTLEKSARSIRASLYQGNISEAFGHYRVLLHKIDDVYVRDFSRVKVSDSFSGSDVAEFLNHFIERERVAGISEGT